MIRQSGRRTMNEPELRRGFLTEAGREAARRIRTRASIAIAITNARLDKGWTQAELAKAAATKQSRVAELESTRGNPTLATIEQVATALGLELTLGPPRVRSGRGNGVAPSARAKVVT